MSARPGAPAGLVALEAAAAGAAYGAWLCWASVALLASFRPGDLSAPYWRAVPGLRADTCGILAFGVAGAGLAVSEYLRLRRQQQTAPGPPAGVRRAPLARALAKTLAVLATGLVAYLSVNAVTHPATMALRATHWVSWPAEGTLRAAALLACAGSAAALRWLLARSLPAVPPGGSGATAGQPPGPPA